MIITQLKLANLRAIEVAEFRFQPGFNLIVGVNGVGKSTVLDALRICMSRVLPSMTKSRGKAMSFSSDDIRRDFPFLDVALSFEHNAHTFSFTRRQRRENFAADESRNIKELRRKILDTDRLRDRPRRLLRELESSQQAADVDVFTPSQASLRTHATKARLISNCIYFSTNRSVASNVGASTSKAPRGEAAAYVEGLLPRPLYLSQFAQWMRVQRALAGERPAAARHSEVLRSAVTRFLPDYENVRPDRNDKSKLLIDHSGMSLDARQLSDGERGVLALVLDLARRLSQANPTLSDPLRDGEATVLIDEIDLHLHPQWQRTIVKNLADVFPRCQFIATTHSPQVVAAVEPDRVLVLTATEVVHPDRSLGMDSNWILRYLMGADDRPQSSRRALMRIETLIEDGAFKKARTAIARERNRGLDLPEWSVFEARMARLEALRK
jgi:predicted ATP-binding protein involved in virulence